MSKVLALHDPIDPLPPERIAMWLALASDLMFFVGLTGAVIVLRSGNASLFADHIKGLNRGLGWAGAVALAMSSVAMVIAVRAARTRSTMICCVALLATLTCAGTFAGLRIIEYADALDHHTIVARPTDGAPLMVFDGRIDWWDGVAARGNRILDGYAAPIPPDFDPHVVSEEDVSRLSPTGTAHPSELYLPAATFQDVRYGPGKNVFYASWFTLTAAQLFHIAVGMIASAVLLVQFLRKKATVRQAEYLGLYWHFCVMIGLFMFASYYLL
jgi:heme/copper-type cytochrome/quinol oxidase subunit 3